MKKILLFLLLAIFPTILFPGCKFPADTEQAESSLAIYSFHGENEQFSISNGILVRTPEKDILYGGEFKEKQEIFAGITAYSMNFYILSNEEEITLLSNAVENKTGEVGSFSGEIGQIAGPLIPDGQMDDCWQHLYFKLRTVHENGEVREYELPLTAKEIT